MSIRVAALLLWFVCTVAGAAEQRPYHVLMLLYRGCEESCQGFQDYFRRQKVPVRFTLRDAEQDKRRIPGFVAEARRLKPDLVLAWGTSVALEAVGPWDAVDPARHITDIPVVFMAVTDPVQSRLVPSLKGSGRNVAGTLYLLPAAEQLRAARSYLDFRKLGFLYNPAEANSRVSLEDIRAQASRFGFTVIAETLPLDAAGKPDAKDIPGHIDALATAGVDLLYFSPDSFMNSQRQIVTSAALARHMPVFAAAEAPVLQADALLGVVVRYHRLGQFTARLALRILREQARPADLPIELPRQFSYLINLRVAHLLGRYPPLPLLDVAEIVGAPACPTSEGKSCD
jgi:putative tryptophan/tyrosine transport system substrate-binding protein